MAYNEKKGKRSKIPLSSSVGTVSRMSEATLRNHIPVETKNEKEMTETQIMDNM